MPAPSVHAVSPNPPDRRGTVPSIAPGQQMPPSHVAPGQGVHEPPSPVLVCHVEDQAQMQAILTRISLLGLDIVDIRPLPDPRVPAPDQAPRVDPPDAVR